MGACAEPGLDVMAPSCCGASPVNIRGLETQKGFSVEPDLFKVINGLLDYSSVMPPSNSWLLARLPGSNKLGLPGVLAVLP